MSCNDENKKQRLINIPVELGIHYKCDDKLQKR